MIKRNLSRDLNRPWKPVRRSWYCIKELCEHLLGCPHAIRFFPPYKSCPTLGPPAFPSLLAGPSQTLKGHRTSIFPPKHTWNFSPGGNRTMIQTERGEKPGQEAKTHPSIDITSLLVASAGLSPRGRGQTHSWLCTNQPEDLLTPLHRETVCASLIPTVTGAPREWGVGQIMTRTPSR